MNEKNLFKIAITCSIIGILILLFITDKIEVKYTSILDINKSLMDKEVKIGGQITNIKETPGLYIVDVRDSTGKITVVIFKEELLNLTKNQLIEVLGTVTTYKNKIEINAKQIKIF